MFVQTRGFDSASKKNEKATFSEAILDPSASFGGLYVPEVLPKVTKQDIEKYLTMSYREIALDLLNKFNVDIEKDILKEALSQYDNFDDPDNPAPVVKIKDNLFVCELYHGPTRSFKDMAIQPFGHILSALAKRNKQKYLIVVATSGDTGPATLEAFRDKEYMQVVCLYPDGKTSDIQRLQMTTESARNVKVLAINGDFDKTQNILKNLINSDEFKDSLKELNIKLSAANSVNFGRIIFQLIYHFYNYVQLINQKQIKMGDSINVTIPSGNFGNALSAYYAKRMGLFINKINIASNKNNILTKFINEGKYDLRDMELESTLSPAMDILKPSNVERILYHKFSSSRTKELMESLDKDNYFELTKSELSSIREDFDAAFSNDSYCMEQINNYFENHNYLFDTHTATCFKFDTNDKIVNLFYSTAEWTKFAPSIYKAIKYTAVQSDIKALDLIELECNKMIPSKIRDVLRKIIMHRGIFESYDVKRNILEFLN